MIIWLALHLGCTRSVAGHGAFVFWADMLVL